MTEQFAAPPPIPTTTTKPRSKWRWLKITIGIVAAGFLAIGLLGSYNPAELELRNPVQRGQRFQRKADSNPVIADSR